MDYIHPSFFYGKITIGINLTYLKYRTTYLLRKELLLAEEAYATGIPLIMSQRDSGSRWGGDCFNPQDGKAYYFTHQHNGIREDVTANVPTPIPFGESQGSTPSTDGESNTSSTELIVSASTITSGMHMAAYMGASNIILCGHDCGTLDGRTNMKEYDDHMERYCPSVDDYIQWLLRIERESLMVIEWLKKHYHCNVHSLNPFINPGLEGHIYKGHRNGP
jgi:hypothetical protein